MKTLRSHLLMVVATSALLACSKKAPEPTKNVGSVVGQGINPNVAALEEAKKADLGGLTPDGKLDPKDPKHGTRKLMGLDVGVFVDGVQTSVLRFGNLPTLPARTLAGGAARYRLYDYVKAIGVTPESIKSIHIHGNADRIASVEGTELLKQKDRFEVQFLSNNGGAPLVEWNTSGLKNEFMVHEIRKMSIYVTKASPLIDPQRQCHVGADGTCSEAIPYASGDAVKGTRVYLDGKMVGFVKRRQLADALLMGNTAAGDQKYNVAKLVAQMGIDATGINAVELVAGDDVIAHADGEKFAAVSPDLFFTLPKHNHGKVRVHVPAGLQAQEPGCADKDALISSVQVFKKTKPAPRDVSAISEDTDLSVQLASNSARD